MNQNPVNENTELAGVTIESPRPAQEYISLPHGLVAAAISAETNTPTEEYEYPRAFVEALRDNLADGLDGCDHSVGICQCSAIGVLEDLNFALEGKRRCRDCGGDGIATTEDAKCSTCSGAGTVCIAA